MEPESRNFQVDLSSIVELLSRNLYSGPRVFVRELLQNGLDAVGNAMFGAPNNTIIMSSVEKKDLGVAGSMNALARNFGMIVGVTLSTTVLYQSMSYKMSEKVTGYVADRPDVFIYGMHVTYIMAVCICLFATLLTIFRLKKSKKGLIANNSSRHS